MTEKLFTGTLNKNKKKDAYQLHSNCAADQRLCFRYTDSTIPLLSKPEISSLNASSVAVQPGLCQTWSETPKTGFLTTRLIFVEFWFFINNGNVKVNAFAHNDDVHM